jgi:hypothetical protein
MKTKTNFKAGATLNHSETLVADGVGGVNGNGTAEERPGSKSGRGLKVKTNRKAGVGDPGI